MAYTMVIYRKKLSDGWTLPYVPASGLEISEDQGTDQFSSINKEYTVPTAVSPMTFAWAGIFPSRAVQWANPKSKTTPHAFRKWVRTERGSRNFFHCIVTTTEGTKIIDGDFIMTKFTFNPRQSGDVDISMEFKEYPKVRKTTSASTKTAGASTEGAEMQQKELQVAVAKALNGKTMVEMVTSIAKAVSSAKYTVKIVNCTALNIRKGPGTSYSTNGTLKKGATVSVNGKSGDGKWLKLANGKGYISAAYAKKV